MSRYLDQAAVLGELYGRVTGLITGLAPDDFERSTRAGSWTVRELLLHLLLDAQRALTTFADPTSEPADVDEVDYWLPFHPDRRDGGSAHARFVRAAAAAYSSPQGLVEQWTETAGPAVHAARVADPSGRFRTQGHVLTAGDFLSTLIVEAAIHWLDLTVDLTAEPAPAAALATVRRVLDGLLGEPVAAAWSDHEYALKGTGRLPLDGQDRAALGAQADRLPLLG